jgi:hypothetical protein
VAAAAAHVESWFSRRIVQVNLTADTRLAALAVEFRSGSTPMDTGFLRFSGVASVNPAADIRNPKTQVKFAEKCVSRPAGFPILLVFGNL